MNLWQLLVGRASCSGIGPPEVKDTASSALSTGLLPGQVSLGTEEGGLALVVSLGPTAVEERLCSHSGPRGPGTTQFASPLRKGFACV